MFPDGKPRILLIRGRFSAPVSADLAALLTASDPPLTLGRFLAALDPGARATARDYFDSGCLVLGS
jgi:hypothetical protein